MSPPLIVIVGAGGHGKVLAEALRAGGVPVRGFVEADPGRHGGAVLSLPVLGGDNVVFGMSPESVELVNGVGSVANPMQRRAVYEKFVAHGFRFRTVVHPAAVVAPDAILSDGAQAMAGVVVQPGCRIGTDAIINTGARIDHDCVVGEHAHVAPGAILCGNVEIGDGTHVGAGATVIQGCRVGAGVLVAAGGVVVRDIPDGTKVAGAPARAMRSARTGKIVHETNGR